MNTAFLYNDFDEAILKAEEILDIDNNVLEPYEILCQIYDV